MKGFKIYRGLENIKYFEPQVKQNPVSDVVDPSEKIFDLIFAKDKFGWPNSSVEVMLSSKTSDEVRRFITDHLFGARDTAHLVNDPSVINEFNKLEGDFIATCSRNRYESIEDYEARLQQIISDSELKSTINRFHEKLKALNLSDDF